MTQRRHSVLLAIGMLTAAVSCDDEQQLNDGAPRTPAQPSARADRRPELVNSGHVYVPIYSHIYVRDGPAEDLAVTLSIRNMSTQRSLVLESVRYYDTSGSPLEDFLDTEATMQPLETVEFFVSTQDRRGGSGANVIVTWHADSLVVKPLVEAVMVHSLGTNKAYAFATRGIEIPGESPTAAKGDAPKETDAAEPKPSP